jgi:1-aminocyclopropane-1-carboxylate deaminase
LVESDLVDCVVIDLISEDEFLSKVQQVPLQNMNWDLAKRKDVEVLIRREDLIDSNLSGNKFYKLFYNLQAAQKSGCNQLLSFGGAYSNHIYALAAAAKRYGFKSIGVIRGERPAQLSATLQDAENFGMQLHFISRADYREKNSQELLRQLSACYGEFFEIPEGGANAYGVIGTKALGAAIYQQVKSDYTSVCLACGTASTLAGVAAGLAHNTNLHNESGNVLGFSVLKGDGNLGAQIIEHQNEIGAETNNWRLISGYHCGGYAKKSPHHLRQFMTEFEGQAKLQLDPVYTVKMCWGVAQLLAQNYWPRGSRLILLHTGGLQGRRGFDL